MQNILSKFEPKMDNLLNILHEVQYHSNHSYISPQAISQIAKYLNTTKAAIYGVVEYYSMFSSRPRGKHVIRLCKSPICRMQKGQDMLNAIQKKLSIHTGGTTKDELFTLELSECLGHCDKAPVMMIDGDLYTQLTEAKIESILQSYKNQLHVADK